MVVRKENAGSGSYEKEEETLRSLETSRSGQDNREQVRVVVSLRKPLQGYVTALQSQVYDASALPPPLLCLCTSNAFVLRSGCYLAPLIGGAGARDFSPISLVTLDKP